MPLFSWAGDRELLERVNKEIYGLYFHLVDVYKLEFMTETVDDIYHEDINTDIPATPNYSVPGYINVTDQGISELAKAGQHVNKQLSLFFSRKALEDTLLIAGMNIHKDVPNDGDVVTIQDLWWEVITRDAADYHMNDRRFPFDYQFLIRPWDREAIRRPRRRRR